MFERNFWTWLLMGIEDVLVYLIELTPLHVYIGLAELAVTPVFYAGIIVFIVFGSFIHLQYGGVFAVLIMVMEFARTIYAAWKWIVKVIPGL